MPINQSTPVQPRGGHLLFTLEWLAVLLFVLFVCDVGYRVLQTRNYYKRFNTDEQHPTLSDFIKYAVYLPRREAPGDACINKLREIDGAKQQWAIETKAASNAVPTWEDLRPYCGRGTNLILPHCPQGGIYMIQSLTNAPTCTIKGHVLD